MGFSPTPFTASFKGLPVNTLRYQTSQQGLPVALVYGTTRVSPNLVEFWGYKAPPGGKGSKGGATGGGGKKSGTYSVNVGFAFCDGQLPHAFTGRSPFNDTWANGGQVPFNGTGLNGFNGADGQNADSTWVASDPNTPVIGYSGLVYTTGDPMQLGPSPALPSFSAEITGFQYGVGTGAGYPFDANPGNIIVDLLSDTGHGAGFPLAALDTGGTLADFANYCQANQLVMSALLDRQRPARDWVKQWLELTSAAAVWSGAVVKIIPYATGGTTGNGATWNPSTLTPIYALDDDDFLPWEGNARDNAAAEPGNGPSDPVQVALVDARTLTNWVSFDYWDVSNSYNDAVAPAFDQGAIDLYGVRPEVAKEAHCFTNATAASSAANIYLARKQAVRRTLKFKLPWRFCLLEPMDVVSLTDGTAGLPAGTAVRVTSVEEDENGELTFEAEELPNVNAGAPPLYPIQAPTNQPLGLFASPGSANPPIIYEPPTALTNGVPVLAIGASGGANWGGAQVWLSFDGTTYASFGTIEKGLPQGVLSASLAAYNGANPDTSDTLSVDLTMSGGSLSSTTLAQAEAGVSLSYVDGELVAFETATLTAASKYNLTTLVRGFAGTPAFAHAGGAQFAFVGIPPSPGIFEFEYPAGLVGQTISIKLLSFNLFANELQSLSSVTAYSYTLTGAGNNPAFNPVLNALAAGSPGAPIDWGVVGTTVIASADLASVTVATGLDINLGTLA